DVGVGDQLVDAEPAQVVLLRQRPACVGIEVGARDRPPMLEGARVGDVARGDDAAADDADAKHLAHAGSTIPRTASRERCVAANASSPTSSSSPISHSTPAASATGRTPS